MLQLTNSILRGVVVAPRTLRFAVKFNLEGVCTLANISHDTRSSTGSAFGIFIAVLLIIGAFIVMRQNIGDGLSVPGTQTSSTTVESPATSARQSTLPSSAAPTR